MINGKNIMCFLVVGFVSVMLLTYYPGTNYAESQLRSDSLQSEKVSVHKIIDGDSLIVRVNDAFLEVRLWGIDAPEFNQPGSKVARVQLQELTETEPAEIFIKDKDRYGRTVAVLYCNGINVNEAMIESGNAWVHIYYCKENICRKWKKLESEARKNHLGMWQYENPVEPWKWKSKR